jgi:hypothetical protein
MPGGVNRTRIPNSPKGPLIESPQEAGKRLNIDPKSNSSSKKKNSKSKMAEKFVAANSSILTTGVIPSDIPESELPAADSAKI